MADGPDPMKLPDIDKIVSWIKAVGIGGGWLVTLGVLVWTMAGDYTRAESEMDRLRRELDRTESEVSRLKDDVRSMRSMLDTVRTDVRWIKQALGGDK